MTQVGLLIITAAKGKLLLSEMNEGDRYAAVKLRHHEIHNILKMQ
jgi:hypothetical protein